MYEGGAPGSRDDAPAGAIFAHWRVKLPITKHVAGRSLGNIVGRKSKAIDGKPDLPALTPLTQYHQMIWQFILLPGGWHVSFQMLATSFDAGEKAP